MSMNLPEPLCLAAVLAVFAVTACASASTANEENATRTNQAASVPLIEGTYGFSLAQSDVAAPLKEQCAGDAACWSEIEAQAKNEKIRFAKDASGQLVWRSFGKDDELYLEAPIDLKSDGPRAFVGTITGPAKGPQAAKLGASKSMRIEVVDEHTIAMSDPKKGRLVFVKE